MPFIEGKKGGDFDVDLKAIYEIAEDKETKKYGIWTGRIEAEIGKYSLNYYKND